MAKKAIRLGKGNRHPFASQVVYFGTKHDKAKALSPLFAEIGMRCETVELDTDVFGTFSGEVERTGSVRETLQLKVNAISRLKPDARFVLASEGSFGPHPFYGFVQSDHEALLFVDRKSKAEIFVDDLSSDTNHDEIEFGPSDDLDAFLARIRFPSHAVIVRSQDDSKIVFKGLTDRDKLGQAIIDTFVLSNKQKVILSTDMRASFNPTRMSAIAKAGEKLLARLKSFCPSCRSVGFGAIEGIKGLPCSDCGLPTQLTKQVLYGCVACEFTERKDREDGLMFASPGECDFCNP